jgi:carboxyl-terminal processing protease
MISRLNRLAAVMALFVLGLASVAHAQQSAETRVALVIGNSAYQNTDVLENPKNDARLMADRLKAAGFKVTMLIDADQATMKRAMVDFGRELRSSDAVGLFYYAGHGLQVNGLNYLVPVNASIKDETEVGIETVSLSEFLATMERAKSHINIVVLDACRNNPFARTFRSDTAGLARVDAPAGTFVAYATAPGSVASDGTGKNSPFTKALAETLLQPGVPIEQTFKDVRRAVLDDTGGQQTPWETSSITGDFSFVRGTGVARPAPAPSATDAARDKELELAFWNSVKDSTNPAMFRSYLQQYPRGTFVPIAKTKISDLEAKAAPASPPPGQSGQASGGTPARGPALVFADSSQRELKEPELGRLSCEQLWLARNELFARNGYCFGTAAAQQVFGTKGCTSSRQDILSPLEQKNMRTIKVVEDRKACGAITTAAVSRSVAAQPAPAAAASWHFVTGLDPKGDNFLALKVAPNVSSARIEKMGPNTLLKIIGSQGEWRQVQLRDGRTGWAHSRYIACCKTQ